ncbi:MAG: hypothetical protein JNL73_17090 [Anaerolineales bacterium]|nr:hypothetical protein [Anaerolineales bacterium]
MANPKYRAFLLRVWWTDDGAWRAVLEDPHTGERLPFAQPEALLLCLCQRDDPGETTHADDTTSSRST